MQTQLSTSYLPSKTHNKLQNLFFSTGKKKPYFLLNKLINLNQALTEKSTEPCPTNPRPELEKQLPNLSYSQTFTDTASQTALSISYTEANSTWLPCINPGPFLICCPSPACHPNSRTENCCPEHKEHNWGANSMYMQCWYHPRGNLWDYLVGKEGHSQAWIWSLPAPTTNWCWNICCPSQLLPDSSPLWAHQQCYSKKPISKMT